MFCSAVCTNRRTVEIFFLLYGLYKPYNSRIFFFSSTVCTNRRTEKNFYCSTVCTNRRTEILNYLHFLQTVEQFNSKKKVHHRRPPPSIHDNYLYNLKVNLQWCLPFFQLLEWVPKWCKWRFAGCGSWKPWMENQH